MTLYDSDNISVFGKGKNDSYFLKPRLKQLIEHQTKLLPPLLVIELHLQNRKHSNQFFKKEKLFRRLSIIQLHQIVRKTGARYYIFVKYCRKVNRRSQIDVVRIK
jgi:hypothetical protein